jgi:hypothetical protein
MLVCREFIPPEDLVCNEFMGVPDCNANFVANFAASPLLIAVDPTVKFGRGCPYWSGGQIQVSGLTLYLSDQWKRRDVYRRLALNGVSEGEFIPGERNCFRRADTQ